MAATLLLILLVAVPGGVIIATVAGALRGRDAVPQFIDYNHGADLSAFIFMGSLPAGQERRLVDQIVALPQWETVGEGRPVVASVRRDGRWVTTVTIGIGGEPYLTELERPILVEGHLPDPEQFDQILVNESFAEALGVHAGDTFDLRTVTPEGINAASSGTSTRDPNGETATMTVTGIGRRPTDLSFEHEANTDVFGTDSWFSMVGPAFLERFAGRLASYGAGVQGRAKPGQGDELAAAIVDAGGDVVSVQKGSEFEEITNSVEHGVDFETSALLLFALVGTVTAAVLVGQAVGRRALIDLDGDDVLRGAGLRRPQRAAVPLVRAVIVGVAGAIGAAAIAIAASPLFPAGLARRAELRAGVHVDPTAIGLGALAVAIAIVARGAVTSWRATRPGRSWSGTNVDERRVSSVSAVAASAGAPVTTVSGLRMALERGRGRTAVPVVGAAIATTAGVVVLTAILVFASSLDRLVATPALQGWTWDVSVANISDPAAAEAAVHALRANPHVDSFIGLSSGPIVVDGQGLYAAAEGRGDPDAGPQPIDGRLPTADDEVAVGRQTLADLGKEIGDTVVLTASPGAPETEARIVGTVVLPAALDRQLTLGRGALMTGDGFTAVSSPGELYTPNTFLVTFDNHTTLAEGTRSLGRDFPETISPQLRADDIENLRRVQSLPRLLALLVGLLALGTLANVLVTSVRRHRRDLATFATLGFRRRQLAATVAWQATTFALLALVLGVPLGIATGRTAWHLMMASIGIEVTPSVPLLVLAAVAAGTVLAANVIASLPARAAARTHPAAVLRSE